MEDPIQERLTEKPRLHPPPLPPSRADPPLNLGPELMMKQQKGSVGLKSATECILGSPAPGRCASQVSSGGRDLRPLEPSLSKAHTVNLR